MVYLVTLPSAAEVVEYCEPVGIVSETAGKLHHVVVRWRMGCVRNHDMGHLLADLFDKVPWECGGDTQSRRSAGTHTIIPKREPLFEIRLNRLDNPLPSVTVIPHHHDVPTRAPLESVQKLEKFQRLRMQYDQLLRGVVRLNWGLFVATGGSSSSWLNSWYNSSLDFGGGYRFWS